MKRITSIFRYLSWTSPFYKWRFRRNECPLCGMSYFVYLSSNNPFMIRCLSCKNTITNLSLIPIVKEHVKGNYHRSVYELSSYGATLEFLKRHFNDVTASEYFPNDKPGSYVNGILNQDVQNLTFSDNSFDIVTSSQVFEHVEDDIKGFSEVYRVLRGGELLFLLYPCMIQKKPFK